MKILTSPIEMTDDETFFRLDDFARGQPVYLKLEGLNPASSIKLKPAIGMIQDLEERGIITPGQSTIIESSSGNLGVALALVCKTKGYRFICVTDPNTTAWCLKAITLYSGVIHLVTERDENGGYLNTRIRVIHEMLSKNSTWVWTNQYANPVNWQTHYHTTARSIDKCFPHLEWLFIGAGTTGTLIGCVNYFNSLRPGVGIVAVDAEGSVTFGTPPGRRYIPGLGTSRRPEIFCSEGIAARYQVAEADTLRMARYILDRYSLFVGGSTATVLCGIKQHLLLHEPLGSLVAICPDFGEKYLDTVYDDHWVSHRFGEILGDSLLDPFTPIAGSTHAISG